MPSSIVPAGDAQALQFCQNFGACLATDPAKYGQTPIVVTEYVSLTADYATDLTTATAETTRTKAAVAAKNASKKAVRAETSRIATLVRGQKGLSDLDLIQLGLKPRKAKQTVQDEPASTPVLNAQAVGPRMVNIVVSDGQTKRKALPVGIKGVSLFFATGPTAPTTADGWAFLGSITRSTCKTDVTARLTDAAATIWLCAFYFNNKAQSGVMSDVVSVDLPAAKVKPAVPAVQPTTMRVAA